MKGKTLGNLVIFLGVCLILAAGALIGYNLWDEDRADHSAQEALDSLMLSLPQETVSDHVTPDTAAPEVTEPPEAEVIPPHILNPDLTMPETVIKGVAYVGVLEIPDLKLELPIASQWNLNTSKTAPCRYTGSAYSNNMVLAGHNYQKHFGKLSSLPIGSQIRFTDMEGNVFLYEIIELETIQATDIDGMCQGDWDLTLFTCTIGGRARSAVRCSKLDDSV